MSTEHKKNTPLEQSQHDAHRDPLSGRAGAHPVGTGVGAVIGGAAVGIATGAALGTVAGPVGTAIGAAAGAAVGAIGGGLAGKATAEDVNPTIEHGYWRSNYAQRPYFVAGTAYEIYAPAYQFGWESQARSHGKTFEQSEITLQKNWEKARGNSTLPWANAKEAARDSWQRSTTHTKKH